MHPSLADQLPAVEDPINVDPNVGQGAAVEPDPNLAPVEPVADPAAPVEPDVYQDIMIKKKFKNNQDFAKSYMETEGAFDRLQTREVSIKQQLETQGFTLDDNGNIIQVSQGYENQGVPQVSQAVPPAQDTQPIYHPYTGEEITNPIDQQLARLPLHQQIGTVVNAILQQQSTFQAKAAEAEKEALSAPEAKGFEDDVKSVMQQLPLEHRANKQAWSDALLRVKGMKYDTALKANGQQAITEFINKDRIQAVPGTGRQTDPTKLTAEQETSFQWYQDNKPGMFKDRGQFLKANDPTGGR
jgi:hypothetical protein